MKPSTRRLIVLPLLALALVLGGIFFGIHRQTEAGWGCESQTLTANL